MARRTYDTIDANLLVRTGNRSEATAARREDWINDALLLCANKYVHPVLQGRATETLTADTDSITPAATDIWWPDMLKDVTNGPQIRLASKNDIERIQTKPTGNPARYYWWGGVFYFDRKPSANTSVRIDYLKRPERWSSGESVLGEEYDVLLEMQAIVNALNFFRDFQAAHIAEVQANNYINEMKFPVREARKDDTGRTWTPRLR